MAKRGMELPINTLIVVSVAVIVLLVVVGLFTGAIRIADFEGESKMQSACMKWSKTRCGDTYDSVTVDDKGTTIKQVCEEYYGATDLYKTKKMCADYCCPMGGGGGAGTTSVTVSASCGKCKAAAGETKCNCGAGTVNDNEYCCPSTGTGYSTPADCPAGNC